MTGSLGRRLLAAVTGLVRPGKCPAISNLQPGRSAGRCGGRPARRPEAMELVLRGLGRALILTLLLLPTLLPGMAQGASYGTPIPNTAYVDYQFGSEPHSTAVSNTVTFTVRSPAVIEFLKHSPNPASGGEPVPVPPPTYYDQGGGNFVAIPPPPTTADPAVPLLRSPLYYLGEMLYLRLTDLDQNLDPTRAETIVITVSCPQTGDVEILRLTETGPDTGVFSGYLPSTATGPAAVDGQLLVADNCQLNASYIDAFDGTDITDDAALIDPYGVVFDSFTGEPINGAIVTLIDTATGLPPQVFGDDTVSIYPATVVTGTIVSDSGGQAYQLPPGGFRFPYILPGNYRLQITPPQAYSAPTTVSESALRSRPWWPTSGFVTGTGWDNGRWTGAFPVDPGPAIRIDVPVDPSGGALWLSKTANAESVRIGEFVQYRLTVENGSADTIAPAVTIDDRLPLGFRYREGSARIDGRRAPEPVISADGRGLTFTVGDIAPGASVAISYVVEIAAGTKPGRAVNRALARDAIGTTSNQAKATVEVVEEFFRDRAILVGRVLTGSCAQDDTDMQGLPGVRIYLEDGTYVVTDKDGKYHYEGVEPGVHVVQVDTTTLPPGFEMLPCEENSQFAGRNFSQFVDLRGGTLWRVNFYTRPVPPPSGEVSLQLFSTLDGDVATLRTELKASTVSVDNLRAMVMLPGGAEFIPGTARQDGRSIDDPSVMTGTVTLRTPHLDAGETTQLTFQARFAGDGKESELPAKALLTFDSPTAKNQRTPVADNSFSLTPGVQQSSEQIRLYPRFPTLVATLQPLDLTMLDQLAARLKGQQVERIEVVGHTDNVRIAPHNRRVFADNQALSVARAHSIAEFLRHRLKLPAGSITERGMGESMPVADNNTAEGRALNRRVDLHIVTAAVETEPLWKLIKGVSELQSAITSGAGPGEARAPTRAVTAPPFVQPPEATSTWLTSLKPETRIVWPEPGYNLDNPSTTIMIQHPQGSGVELRINGLPTNPLNFVGAKPVPKSQFLVSRWEGLGVGEGLNRIEATITGSGVPIELEQELWFVANPEKLTFVDEQSVLLADGISPPTIALRLTDRDGHPVFQGRKIEYRVSAPYRSLQNQTVEDTLASAQTSQMVIGAGGIAYAQLEPTPQAGEVTITVLLPDNPQEVTTWLKPASRDWILVGFAEGTVGHNTLQDNAVSAEAAGINDHDYTDGRVKFFAKGAIKGEWLLTLAFDSDKPDLDGDSLRQTINPDTYYPLYQDETLQGYEASSARDVYVKLERDQFYALFGDMETGLSQTVLSQYSRSINGFKSELRGERLSYTIFVADTKQAFVKDELRGDGTSGRYALSNKNLVINSEEVIIETRDRFHNERIVKEESLARYADYDIDYDAGTLYFKRPVPSKDAEFNPIFIMVRYETQGSESAKLNYGGRVASMVTEQVEVGASLIHEEAGDKQGDLYGADVTVRLTPQTTLRLEAAVTDDEAIDGDFQGDAYLAEVEHSGETINGRAWFRQQAGEFGLGQQNGGTNGMRTYGAQGSYLINPRWNMVGELWHEDNLDTAAKRDVGSVQALYIADRFSLMTGVREARDKFENGEAQTSRQLIAGGSWRTSDGKLTLRANHAQSLGSSNDNVDYPTRTLIGADYQLTQKVSLFAEQEFTWGEQTDTEGTRVGIKTTPWRGGEIHSMMEQQISENSERIFALFGLGQNWQINKNWSIDLAIDRSYTIKNEAVGERVNPDAAPASGGDDDFTAVSVGAAYRGLKWSWWNRLETRQGDSEDKVGISSGLVSEVNEETAVSARVMAFITRPEDGGDSDEEEITLGLAYRPDQSRWIMLERLDLSLYNDDDNDSMRIVNHLHTNYRTTDRKWQTSFYYGLKYVRENFDGDQYNGFTDMLALETRYNLTKRWDIGVNGAALHSWNSNQLDYSAGASIGCQVLTNSWISLGYNLHGFEDDDFSAANYTAEGVYLKLRVKFDQQSVKEAVEWLNK